MVMLKFDTLLFHGGPTYVEQPKYNFACVSGVQSAENFYGFLHKPSSINIIEVPR